MTPFEGKTLVIVKIYQCKLKSNKKLQNLSKKNLFYGFSRSKIGPLEGRHVLGKMKKKHLWEIFIPISFAVTRSKIGLVEKMR